MIACNTASALALPQIKAASRVPVVGVVEPGAAMASEVSRSRAAIVIATEATVTSHAYRDALQRHGVEAFEKACPLFVPLVEEGWTEHPVTEQVARIYLDEAMQQANADADVLVLACTHYPLIAPLLRRITPEQMKIVDSAESTARVVKKMVGELGLIDPTLSQRQQQDGAPLRKDGTPDMLPAREKMGSTGPFASMSPIRWTSSSGWRTLSGAAGRSRGARGLGRMSGPGEASFVLDDVAGYAGDGSRNQRAR